MFSRSSLVFAVTSLFAANAAFGACRQLTFDQDNVLPSAQGFTYVGQAPEASVFSTSGGLLHLNSIGTRTYAYYQASGAYDPARDFELKFRMRVLSVTGPFGLDFEVSDATTDYEFGFMEDGVYLPPPGRPFFPLAPTTDGSITTA